MGRVARAVECLAAANREATAQELSLVVIRVLALAAHGAARGRAPWWAGGGVRAGEACAGELRRVADTAPGWSLWGDPESGATGVSAHRLGDVLAALAIEGDSAPSPEDIGDAYAATLAFGFDVRDGERRVWRGAGSGRRERGAFHTPERLVGYVLDRTLAPVLSEAGRGACVRVCDPACGAGRFLSAVVGRLVEAGCPVEVAVCERVFGVDLDPIVVDLCRLALWSSAPHLPLSCVDGQVRVGNALLGARVDQIAGGIPADAYRSRKGEDAGLARELARRRRAELDRAVADESAWSDPRGVADAWCASFFWSELDRGEAVTPATLAAVSRGADVGAGVAACAARHAFFHWPLEFEAVRDGGFDVVLGNPPFKNQLESKTASAAGVARLIRASSGGVIGGYADLACAFWALGLDLARPGGRVGFVLPRSILGVAHAAAVRRAVSRRSTVESVWISDGRAFAGASVETVVPVVRVDGGGGDDSATAGEVRVFRGESFDDGGLRAAPREALASAEAWGFLAERPGEVPVVSGGTGGVVSDLASCTADFRDEYYGLRGKLLDAERVDDERALPRLVTSGLLDLAECRWGDRAARVHRRVYSFPRVRVEEFASGGRLERWAAQRLVPKILVATQTRVIEAWVDESGDFLPSLPVITVAPHELDDLWRVGAAIASPVNTAFAVRTFAGTALTTDAVKLSASQVGRLGLPLDGERWERGASAFARAHAAGGAAPRRAALVEFAACMNGAYGVEGDASDRLSAWWFGRMDRRGRRTAR